ncbi:MAG: amidohydrolase family protein [Candidatus Eiseniibacteriota bacterium]|jgi:hypothetical protein
MARLDGHGRVLFTGGTILIDAASGSTTDALLVDGARIAAHGAAARAAAATGDRSVEGQGDGRCSVDVVTVALGGRALLPGFIDAHTHLAHRGFALTGLDLSGTRSAREVIERTREALAKQEPGRPLIGEGWDDSTWVTGGAGLAETLDGTALDRLSAETPILLRRVCGHKAAANRVAIDTLLRQDPTLDRPQLVDRRRGLLLELAALRLRRAFAPTASEIEVALHAAVAEALSHGITAVHDLGDAAALAAAAALRARGEAGLRTVFHMSGADRMTRRAEATATIGDDAWLRVGGVKLFLDGSVGARTAALEAPYQRPDGGPAEHGQLLLDPATLEHQIAAIHARGWQAVVHVIGDRAIARALDAFARLGPAACRERRHRLEHVELLPPALLERLAASGLTVCLQPNFIAQWQAPGGLYMRMLGEERWRWMNRLGAIHEHQIPLAFGSDCMPLGPLYGIGAAVHHPVDSERLTVDEALAAYTTAADAASPAAEPLGTLEIGRRADCVLLDRDPRGVADPAASRVLATVVDGRLAHAASA